MHEANELLSFRHLSESRILIGALHRSSEFANFCHSLMQNHLSKLLVLKKTPTFIVVIGLKKTQIFSLFPTVKMNANNAEICRVGNLKADFRQVPLFHFFFFFFFFSF